MVRGSAAEAEPTPDLGDDVHAADQRLVAGLRARDRWAAEELVARYRPLVSRVLTRVLGEVDGEHADLVQEVFTRAWFGARRLKEARSLPAWLTQIAVFTARGTIRARKRRRWLAFLDRVPEPQPDPSAGWATPELKEAARCVYRILDAMPVEERLVFSLRTLGGLDLEAAAAACGMSLATTRRRFAKAEARFLKLARQADILAPWLEGGS